jgi:thioredoxin reductase (NADPH)
MITSQDLEKIPVFVGVDEQERQRLARRAADILLEPGEWLIREGEEPRFFVILEGELEVLKDIVGQPRSLGKSVAGEFAGEIPIFMGTANPVSLRAVTKCRAARFERQQLQELVRDSPSAGELIFQTMSKRQAQARYSVFAGAHFGVEVRQKLPGDPRVFVGEPGAVRLGSEHDGGGERHHG